VSVTAVAVAVERANRAILDEAERNPERRGMGTTVAGVALVEQAGSPHWLVFNVGDSRVYRLTAEGIEQLSVDHSEVSELVAAKRLTPEDARTHPLRNVVTRSVGTWPAPVPDTWLVPMRPDDIVLVCSDGLTGEIEDDRIAPLIAPLLAGDTDLEGAAQALVSAAVAAGGRDNVTVVLVRPDGALVGTAGGDPAETTTLPRTEVARRAAGGS
jgi:PPM family protein phosphatase